MPTSNEALWFALENLGVVGLTENILRLALDRCGLALMQCGSTTAASETERHFDHIRSLGGVVE